MIKILSLILIFLFPLFSFSQEEDRWKSFMFTSNEIYFYDSITIRVTGTKIRVWIKTEPFPWTKDEVIQRKKEYSLFDKDKYEKYSHSKIYYEIDCQKRCIKPLKTILYNNDGSVIDSFDFNKSECDEPIPETIGEELFNKICELRRRHLKQAH